MYYSNIDFVELCTFSSVKYRKGIDKEDWSGTSFFYRYSKKELSEIIGCELVDKKGEWACYNECALLFLKKDTLINICGGYTLLFKKINR